MNITIVGFWEDSPYCTPKMWQVLANNFSVELVLIPAGRIRDTLPDIINQYSHRTWIRLTPQAEQSESLDEFQHPEGDAVYFVGPDAQPLPEIPGAIDVHIPLRNELHALTAMAIALWDRHRG